MPASDRIRELEQHLDLAIRVKDTWMVRYIAAHDLLSEVAAGDIPSPDWYERVNALLYPRTAAEAHLEALTRNTPAVPSTPEGTE